MTHPTKINQWPFIYAEVFCYFSILYPTMSTFIPWGPSDAPQDPEKVKAFANNMIQFTDPGFWDSTASNLYQTRASRDE